MKNAAPSLLPFLLSTPFPPLPSLGNDRRSTGLRKASALHRRRSMSTQRRSTSARVHHTTIKWKRAAVAAFAADASTALICLAYWNYEDLSFPPLTYSSFSCLPSCSVFTSCSSPSFTPASLLSSPSFSCSSSSGVGTSYNSCTSWCSLRHCSRCWGYCWWWC